MQKLLDQEWFRSLFLALMIIGILLLAFGVIRYFTLSYQMGQNLAFQIQAQSQNVDPQTMAEAQGLMASNEALRQIEAGRSQSVIFSGAGLVLIAVGWLGRDWVQSKRRKTAKAPTSAS
ncbi:MAG: hypothetical protein IAE89_02975 [Anaerolineae bacterium]|nr:hypothetical protein [Anaerolineae bacterium]